MYRRPRYDLVVSSSKQENDPDEQETITDPSVPYGLRAVSGCDHEKFVGGYPTSISYYKKERCVAFLRIGTAFGNIIYTYM